MRLPLSNFEIRNHVRPALARGADTQRERAGRTIFLLRICNEAF